MIYTEEQIALISGVIGTQILTRARSERLRETFFSVHERLYRGQLDRADLLHIKNALELVTPSTCPVSSKEGYRDLVEALTTTKLMLREARLKQ